KDKHKECVSSNMSVEAKSVASDSKVVMGKESARQILQNGQQVANKPAAGEVARTHTMPAAGLVRAGETNLPLLMNASEAARVDPPFNPPPTPEPTPLRIRKLDQCSPCFALNSHLVSLQISVPRELYRTRTRTRTPTHARAHHSHVRRPGW
ncbi:MAG: hypothetical protein ACPIOQ_15415, partial [Promethearchaeia archaeon]